MKDRLDALGIAKYLRTRVGRKNAVTESMIIAGCWCYEYAIKQTKDELRKWVEDNKEDISGGVKPYPDKPYPDYTLSTDDLLDYINGKDGNE